MPHGELPRSEDMTLATQLTECFESGQTSLPFGCDKLTLRFAMVTQ